MKTGEGLTSGSLAAVALLSSCTSPQITNAPPTVVESCRQEIALITEREPSPLAEDAPFRGTGPESAQNTIEDARTAREEANIDSLADWPQEVLMYRCLLGRGIKLTPEQAKVLAEWKTGHQQE